MGDCFRFGKGKGPGEKGSREEESWGESLARAGWELGAGGSGDRARRERREGGRGQPMSEERSWQYGMKLAPQSYGGKGRGRGINK